MINMLNWQEDIVFLLDVALTAIFLWFLSVMVDESSGLWARLRRGYGIPRLICSSWKDRRYRFSTRTVIRGRLSWRNGLSGFSVSPDLRARMFHPWYGPGLSTVAALSSGGFHYVPRHGSNTATIRQVRQAFRMSR